MVVVIVVLTGVRCFRTHYSFIGERGGVIGSLKDSVGLGTAWIMDYDARSDCTKKRTAFWRQLLQSVWVVSSVYYGCRIVSDFVGRMVKTLELLLDHDFFTSLFLGGLFRSQDV